MMVLLALATYVGTLRKCEQMRRYRPAGSSPPAPESGVGKNGGSSKDLGQPVLITCSAGVRVDAGDVPLPRYEGAKNR